MKTGLNLKPLAMLTLLLLGPTQNMGGVGA